MRIEEIFGSLGSIDMISKREDCVDLLMIVNGYVDGSAEELAALNAKLKYYNDYAESDEFMELYPGIEVFIAVSFTERPSDKVLTRLYEWYDDMANSRAELKATVAGLPLYFIWKGRIW
ncbi:MAG: hypothetical protein IKN17_13805 [Ruminococcus sp.]|nr:hypothetical protein [Ruminococcus sp.]